MMSGEHQFGESGPPWITLGKTHNKYKGSCSITAPTGSATTIRASPSSLSSSFFLVATKPVIYAVIIPLALFAIALATRTYAVSIFPYFKPEPPWFGAAVPLQPALAGIYNDENTNVQVLTYFRSDPFSLVGGGFVAPALIFLSTHVLGLTLFAVRIPFAIISSFTSVMVYFTTRKTSGGSVSAILSSLYFIVMMPSLIFGRMAFGENLIGLLFICSFYCILKVNESKDDWGRARMWLFACALLGGISIIVKLSGVVVVLFFAVYLARKRMMKKGGPYALLSLVIGLGVAFAVFELLARQAPIGVVHSGATHLSNVGAFTVGSELSIFRFFLLDTLPSGQILYWGAVPIPEFWYLFLYFTLGVLILQEYSRYSDLVLALAVFAAFVGVIEPIGSYFLIIIQPLMAIAIGPGLKRAVQIPLAGSLAFYIFLFAPLATSLGITLIIPAELGNPYIYGASVLFWKLLVVLPPFVLLLLFSRFHVFGSKWRLLINAELFLVYIAVLIIASFLVPDLYRYYL